MDKKTVDSLLYELDQAYFEVECLRNHINYLYKFVEQFQKLKQTLQQAEIYIHGKGPMTLEDILAEINNKGEC